MKSGALRPILVGIATGGAAFVAIIFFAPRWLEGWLRFVACYDVAVAAILAWYWAMLVRTKDVQAKVLAAADDPGRNATLIIAQVAVGVGLLAALLILGRGPHNRGSSHELAVDGIGFVAVLFGWLLIHTIFTFHYAHLFYRDRDRDKESDRGLTFPGNQLPDYYDFAYFSFVIGMTFQVSDVQITARPIRHWVLWHGLISFGYNTAILAFVVNVVVGLVQR